MVLRREESLFYYWFVVLVVTALGLSFVIEPTPVRW